MKKVIVLMLVAGSLLFCLPINLWAQCSEVLKYGIFDMSSKSTDEAFVESIINDLSQHDYASAADYEKSAGGGGISIIKIGISADFEKTRSSSSSWSKSLATYLRTHKEDYKKFKEDVASANPHIISAWLECVKNQKGLVAWVTPSANENEIVLSVEGRPKVARDSGKKVRLMVDKSENLQGSVAPTFVLGTAPGRFLIKRSSCEGINILVKSDDPEYVAEPIMIKGNCPVLLPPCDPTKLITGTLVKRKGKDEWALLLVAKHSDIV